MISLSTASHAAAVVAFCALTLLFAFAWKGGGIGLRFILAGIASALWAIVAGINDSLEQKLPALLLFSSEMTRDAAWLVALTGLAGGLVPRALARSAQWLCIALLAATWMLPLAVPSLSSDAIANAIVAPSGIAVAVIVLLLIEQIYRNSNATGRYGFKYLAVGLGGVYAFDLFMFSQAQLLGGIPAIFWDSRGIVNAALVPLIAIAARRNPQWSLDVFVSRQAVLFTTSIFAVGVYLLVVSLGGYLIQAFGGRWGVVANLLFVSGAVAVLAMIVMSGRARRRLRVFVHKHFYRNKYDYRVEWLRFVKTLSSAGGEDIPRTSLRAIAEVFESDGGVLYAHSASRRHYEVLAAWPWGRGETGGPDLPPIPEDDEFISALRDRHWVIDLVEYREEPEFYQNMSLPPPLQSLREFRVIAPLLDADRLAGFVLLRDPPPPFELTYEDRDLLLTLGRHVASILSQQESERRLAEVRQFEAYHRLTAFMMHDLKNLVAQLNLVVRNSERHRNNQQFVDDAFRTVANAASRMGQLIAQLGRPDSPGEAGPLNVEAILADVVRVCGDREPVPRLVSSADVDLLAVARADRNRLTSVLEHVVRNAQDASRPEDPLDVLARAVADKVEIEVRDSGTGMSAEFIRTRLFNPFDSTKGSKGMGIGAYQVQEYVRSIGGDVEVQSSPGAGTRFMIRLPRHG